MIERTFSLPEVPDVMRHLAAGHVCGKLVVNPVTKTSLLILAVLPPEGGHDDEEDGGG